MAKQHRHEGHEVIVWDRAGGDISCDITDPQVDHAAESTINRVGAPRLLSITAGIGHSGLLIHAPASEWDRVMDTNAKGVWLAMRALARRMLESDGGSIVVTSSISGRLADATMGIYCASKAALDMLVVAVAAREWAPKLRVNAVARV